MKNDKEFLVELIDKYRSDYTATQTWSGVSYPAVWEKDMEVWQLIQGFMENTKVMREDQASDDLPFVMMLSQSVFANSKELTRQSAPITYRLIDEIEEYQKQKSKKQPELAMSMKAKNNKLDTIDQDETKPEFKTSTKLIAMQMLAIPERPASNATALFAIGALKNYDKLDDSLLLNHLKDSGITHITNQEKYAGLLAKLYDRLMGPFCSSIGKLWGSGIDPLKEVRFSYYENITALTIAVMFNKTKEVEQLLQLKANVNYAWNDYAELISTPFYWAIINQNEALLDRLLLDVSDPHFRYTYHYLLFAIEKEFINIVQRIFNFGIKGNATICETAAAKMNFKLLELVLTHSTDFGNAIGIAMASAIRKNNEDYVKQLAECKKYDFVNSKCHQYLAIQEAARYGHINLIKILLDHNAVVKDVSLLADVTKLGDINLVKVLLDKGVEINFKEIVEAPVEMKKIILACELQRYIDDLEIKLKQTESQNSREIILLFLGNAKQLQKEIDNNRPPEFLDSDGLSLLHPVFQKCYRLASELYLKPQVVEEKKQQTLSLTK